MRWERVWEGEDEGGMLKLDFCHHNVSLPSNARQAFVVKTKIHSLSLFVKYPTQLAIALVVAHHVAEFSSDLPGSPSVFGVYVEN